MTLVPPEKNDPPKSQNLALAATHLLLLNMASFYFLFADLRGWW